MYLVLSIPIPNIVGLKLCGRPSYGHFSFDVLSQIVHNAFDFSLEARQTEGVWPSLLWPFLIDVFSQHVPNALRSQFGNLPDQRCTAVPHMAISHLIRGPKMFSTFSEF